MTELDLTLGEDGQLLSDAARQLIDERAPASRLRQLRDDPRGWSLELWRELGELGWIGAQLPEASGGAGLSFLDAALLQREAGRQLAPEPLWSTGVLGAELLRAREELADSSWHKLFSYGWPWASNSPG